jgi:alpha-methylacyl-CoA racemase
MAYFYGGLAGGTWVNRRHSNLLDGGDWRYGTWQCADGRYVSTALLQPKFLRAFREKSGIDLSGLGDPDDRDAWPAYRSAWRSRSPPDPRRVGRAVDGNDDNVMPVLDLEEAPQHPQNRQRSVRGGRRHQPAGPRPFSRTVGGEPVAPALPGRRRRSRRLGLPRSRARPAFG